MIAHLHGTVFKCLERQVIIKSSGVGYLVAVNNDLMGSLREGQEAALFIHTQVKEDDLSLFGFLDMAQMRLFKQLIGVSGIGAKTAMSVLDLPLDLIYRAVHDGDTALLTQVPGLGKKTAERLILELKGKVDLPVMESPASSAPRALQDEAIDALLSLGYDKPSIIRFLNSTDGSYDSAEDLVTSFLQGA